MKVRESKDPQAPRIVIVGGGLSGLTVAYRLRERLPQARLTVLESQPRVGGNIGTQYVDGFRLETGPNGFLDNKPSTVQLCRDLGLSDRLIAASEGSRKNRFVFVDQRLQRLPGSPIELLRSPLLSWSGKLAFLLEPLRHGRRSNREESVAEFATRRAGREAANVFADALVTGIQGGDPQLLSLPANFPRLVELERRYGSIVRGVLASAKAKRRLAQARGETPAGPPKMWSFREGLGVLIDALREQLGAAIVCGAKVRQLDRDASGWQVLGEGRDRWSADVVVLTQPAYEQAEALDSLDSELADELRSIPYNAIVVVGIGYRQTDVPLNLDGFGFIAPQRTRRDILGVQWCSSIFPDRAPSGLVLWRVLCGGWHRGEMVHWDAERLLVAVRQELQQMMGVTAEPVFHRIIRWPRAIPQYFVGHLARLQRIEARVSAEHPSLFLAGNAYRGIAMNDCTEQGQLLAERIVHGLQSPDKPATRAW